MPTARGDSYTGPDVFAGIAASVVAPSVRTALIGDSLTDKNVALGRNLHPFWWLNGLAASGAQKLVANAGINGNTAAQMLARVNNAYSNASPGLAGLGELGIVYLRGFANDARAGSSWASIESTVLSLLAAIKSYCARVVILSASPIGTPDAGFAASNALQTAYNVQLAAIAAADPGAYTFVDDNTSTRDGSGVAVANCFTDGVHTSGRGIYLQGLAGAAGLGALFDSYGYTSPLVTDPADVYPTTQQLVPNHLMAGTGGTAGAGITGAVADDWVIEQVTAGNTATVSKVAADGGDPNTTPWQRIAPTAAAAGTAVRMRTSFDLLTLASTGNAIEMMFELRLNAFQTAFFSVLRAYVTTSSGDVTNHLDLKFGVETISQQLVVRMALPRSNSGAFSFPQLRLDLIASASNSGAMGSIDIRNVTARQE